MCAGKGISFVAALPYTATGFGLGRMQELFPTLHFKNFLIENGF